MPCSVSHVIALFDSLFPLAESKIEKKLSPEVQNRLYDKSILVGVGLDNAGDCLWLELTRYLR